MSPADAPKRRSLGRGLDALFGEQGPAAEAAAGAPRMLPIEVIEPGPFQPRRRFDTEELEQLTESVRAQGILQPLLVRPVPGHSGTYHIVAGERRWRAAQRARLHEVPVVIRELTDREALQLALIENVQRQDLTALEEAEGFARLVREFHYSQDEIARSVGKSRSHIANTIRLLDLPKPVREHLQSGRLSAGHGRALLGCADPEAAAKEVLSKGLNVRQTELLARTVAAPEGSARPARPRAAAVAKDADTQALEAEMSELLGLRVLIDGGTGGAGSLTIHYGSLEQLDDVLQRLGQGR